MLHKWITKLLWTSLCLAAAGASATEIRVCQQRRMGEPCVTLRQAVPNLASWGLSNRISSFDIRSGSWQMCTGTGFGGNCRVFENSVSDLQGTPWQNAISSLRPMFHGGGGWGNWTGGGAVDPRWAVLFDRPGFRGTPLTVTGAVSNLARLGFGNRASSMRLSGSTRWQLCSEPGYRGRCRTLGSSSASLNSQGLDRQVMSMRPVR